MTNYDLWNTTTKKKIAFDCSAELALHWICRLATDKGREYVRDHVRMMYWPRGRVGTRFEGHELLDLLDSAKLYGVPTDDVLEDIA